MTAPDAYTATWLLAILRDDATGLNLTQRAADLGCEPTLAAVTGALEEITKQPWPHEQDCRCEVCRCLAMEDDARARERRESW
jgi:hypothetical protein